MNFPKRPQRPSHKELSKKLSEAIEALTREAGLFCNPGKVVGELDALHLGQTSDVWPLILRLLAEIQPTDYAGARPPLLSYEKSIEGQEIFAFSWDSQELKGRTYLKFALKGGRFYYVSLHPDRPKKSTEDHT
ncbi:MAG: hypothetical protein AB7K68_12735 [Bacteriovoracia bacterium]